MGGSLTGLPPTSADRSAAKHTSIVFCVGIQILLRSLATAAAFAKATASIAGTRFARGGGKPSRYYCTP
jgi:hypothetical protein